MKANEVLSRYDAGDRNFRNENLQGQSFRGKDLSEADFSKCDIRGANFSNAILQKANFSNAIAGLQHNTVIFQLILSILLAAFLSFVAGILNSIFIANFFQSSFVKTYGFVPGIAIVGGTLAAMFTIAHLGLTLKSLIAVLCIGIIAGAYAVASSGIATVAVLGVVAVVGAIIGAIAITISIVVTVTVAGAITIKGSLAMGTVGAVSMIGAVTGASIVTYGEETAVNIAIAVVKTVTLLSICISWWVLEGHEKFAVLRDSISVLTTLGGTQFYQTDLTGANFTQATLKNTDLRESNLTHVYWRNTNGLEQARVENTVLANLEVRNLLISGNGVKKSYIAANLEGANLTGAELKGANLQRANLNKAILRKANLGEANLREIRALGTDFTGAFFTGACIESWSTDQTTNLENIDCQYIYLLHAQKERRPSSGCFAPGEFTKLFQEALNTVDLIFSNGVDWRAFALAFHHVQIENEGTELAVQGFEAKGDGVVVVRVSVPSDVDKTKIHDSLKQDYELELKALKAAYQAELKAKEEQIILYRQQSADMTETIRILANRPITVEVTAKAESKAMNDSTDSSRNINARDMNLTGSTLNLGEISGNVTNTINQLPDEPATADQPSLKDLLTQLQQAITTDTDLEETDKADLLEQVQALATVKQTKEPAQKEGIVRKSKKMFEATLKNLPDTAKIVEACSKLLPLILKALGMPV